MGFYATTAPVTADVSGRSRPAQADPPSKNRVRGFRGVASIRARFPAPQPLETQWEIASTPTKTAPGLSDWLSRDPIGEADTPNGYEYVLNSPVNEVDFIGLWTVTREGQTRAKVRAERDRDSFDDLARITGLDKSHIRIWLTPYKAQNKVKNCEEFTIPNTIIVAIADMNSLAHFTLEGTAQDVKGILERKKYNVLYHDYKTAAFGADAIRHPDLYGLVLFGHGAGGAGGKFNFWWHDPLKGAYVIYKDGLIIDDNDNSILVPSGGYPDRSMGLFIGKFCYAEQGGWDKVVSANGKKWIGSGLEASVVTWGIRSTAEAVPGN